MSAPTITDLPSIPSPGDSDFETAAVTLLTAFKNVFVGEVNDFGEYLDGGTWLTDAILPVSKGGTGASSFTSGYLPYYDGSKLADSPVSSSSGNVGIGTTTPKLPLIVTGAPSPFTGYSSLQVICGFANNVTAYNESPKTSILFNTKYASTGGTADVAAVTAGKENNISANANGYLSFHTRTNGSTDIGERMRITSNGNVGIGTSSPGSKLSVYADTNMAYFYDNINQTDFQIVGASGKTVIGTVTNSKSLSFKAENIERMTLDNSGNLGIGKTPAEKLDVDGNIKAAGMVYPSASNTYSLGKASNLWSEVFAANGTINTSDAREKTEIRQFTADELNAAKLLANEIGLFKFLSSVALKGEEARTHVGMTVQRAIEIMQSCNLDPFAYGFICYDEWDRKVVEHPEIPARPEIPAQEFIPAVIDPETGNIISAEVPAVEYSPAVEAVPAWTEVLTEAGNRYGFRYDQLNLFMLRGFYQMSVDAVSNLQAQINALKSV